MLSVTLSVYVRCVRVYRMHASGFAEGDSEEEEEKLRENRNRMCLALAYTDCVTFDDTMPSVECAGEILMRSEVCRTNTTAQSFVIYTRMYMPQ